MAQFESKKLEDCIDGSFVYEYLLTTTISQEMMVRLGSKARVDFYADFPRPFFKIFTGRGVQIKGIIGESSIQVVFPQTGKDELKADFERLLRQILES